MMQNKLRKELNFNYESFFDSRNYLFKHCRKLEQVRFSCLFENLNQDSLLEQITTYQNNDGGFGHGLEPDLRTRYSSSLCTTVALQILNDMKAIKKHRIIKKAIVYLENTFNQKTQSWRIIPEKAQFDPHAPWWNQINNEKKYTTYNLNPTSEIVSYFIYYNNQRYSEFIENSIKNIKNEISNRKAIGMHDYLCLMRLYKNCNHHDDFKILLKDFLIKKLYNVVELNTDKWDQYCLQPLQIAESPKSEFYPILKKYIPLNLKYVIDSHNHDGSWAPAWSWGNYHKESWERAQEEWKGVLIYEHLKILKNYDLIENA